MGLFYKKATNKGAVWGILLSAVVAFYFKVGPNGWVDSVFFPVLPWMDQMMITWILSMLIIAVVSHFDGKGEVSEKAILINKETFKTGEVFNLIAFAIIVVLSALYFIFW